MPRNGKAFKSSKPIIYQSLTFSCFIVCAIMNASNAIEWTAFSSSAKSHQVSPAPYRL